MNIYTGIKRPGPFPVHQDTRKSPLEHMPYPPSLLVKPDTVTDIQPLYCRTGVSPGSSNQKMIVINHQCVSMNLDPIPAGHFVQKFKKMLVVTSLFKNRTPLYSSGSHMIPPTLNIYPQWPCHTKTITTCPPPRQSLIVDCRDVTLFTSPAPQVNTY